MFEQLLINCGITTVAYLVAFALYFAYSRPTNKVQACDLLLMVFLIIVTGVRFEVGADWRQYFQTYSNILLSPSYIQTIISWYGLDSGFWVLMSYVARMPFGSDPHAVFWVVSVLTYPAMVLYFRKKTDSAPWAFLAYLYLGFFGSSINVLRHALAAICCLWAFEARVNKKYGLFLLTAVFALVFHSSSFFALFVALIAFGQRPSKKYLFGCIGVGCLGLAFFGGFFRVLSTFLPFLNRFQTTIDNMGGDLRRQYMWIVSFIYFSLACVLVLIYLRQTEGNVKRDQRMDAIVCAICLALIPNIVSFAVWPVDRMAFFTFLMTVALVPRLIKLNPKLQVPFLLAMIIWHVPYALFSWDNVSAFTSYLF